jgi:hypothetical protein
MNKFWLNFLWMIASLAASQLFYKTLNPSHPLPSFLVKMGIQEYKLGDLTSYKTSSAPSAVGFVPVMCLVQHSRGGHDPE